MELMMVLMSTCILCHALALFPGAHGEKGEGAPGIRCSRMHKQFHYIIYHKIIRILTLLTQTRVIIWKLKALYYCLLVRAI